MVDLKKMEVWEEEIFEVSSRYVSLVLVEKNVVEDRLVYKVVEVDMMVVASMLFSMVEY